MQKAWLGNTTIIALALINIALWFIFMPVNDGTLDGYYRQLPAEILSSTAMVLMATALFISTRPRYLESFFGGLDKMYLAHKNAGMAAFLLVTAHFFLLTVIGSESAGETEPAPVTVSLEWLSGVVGEAGPLGAVGDTLGLIAFAGILVLVLLTVAPRLPLIGAFTRFSYSKWKWTHKFIGLFFVVGFVHSVSVDALLLTQPVLLSVLAAVAVVGAVSYIYTEIFSVFFKGNLPFAVESVEKLNGTTTEVSLRPLDRKPGFTAGQFAFVGFPGVNGLGEPHPFTVASSPSEDRLRFAIKASGDWTRLLNTQLEAGAQARVDGCYGRFNYKTGGPEQIWVAGGIGITPFMSWIRDFNGGPDADVDMFYTVRSQGDLLFEDEITSAAAESDNFHTHVRISSEDGNLTVEQIAVLCRGDIRNKHIYMCGPIGMMVAMERQFKGLGVPGKNIHYEEFNFR